MKRNIAHAAALAATLIALAAEPARAAAGDLYLTGGSTDVTEATYQNNILFAGEDAGGRFSDSNGVPYVATLNVRTGANVYVAAAAFNTSTTNVSGGRLLRVYGYDASTTNITGGTITGTAIGFQASTINISGGSVSDAIGSYTSTFNISGGTVPNGLELGTATATARFVGAGLSCAYDGYRFVAPPTGIYADTFTISGTFGGVSRSYDLYIYNPNGASGTPNGTQRQFDLVNVPEADTPALAGVGMIAAGAARARRKSQRNPDGTPGETRHRHG